MSTIFDNEMMKALEADGEYLRQMTGEDHGPVFLLTCEACAGEGLFHKKATFREAGCGFQRDDTYEVKCEVCDGFGTVLS